MFARFTFAGPEVIVRQLNFLTGNQFVKMVRKQLEINRFECFKVWFTIFTERRLIAIQKIIVELKRIR